MDRFLRDILSRGAGTMPDASATEGVRAVQISSARRREWSQTASQFSGDDASFRVPSVV